MRNNGTGEWPMIHLRTLGGLDLKGGDSAGMRSLLAQPKRVALLAYLALARPRGYHRRDSLLALFWPEKDAEHGRNALRQALHGLRQSLGAELLDSRGDHDIGLNWPEFTCDAHEFESALDGGRSVEALELYYGDLLPGFFAAGSEFEQWLDGERLRLRRRAGKEAWVLSDRASSSGDIGLAVMWARHVAAFSPADEASVKRLIDLLARAGDRTEVARVYESYKRRLADDYKMEPSVEMEALAKRIFARQMAPAQSSWSLSAERRTPEWTSLETQRHQYHRATDSPTRRIAVLPFATHSASRFEYLREGAAEMLSATLDGAGAIRTVDSYAVRGYCGADQQSDLQLGKALAHRFGADRFILGAVISAGRRICVKASLHEADGAVKESVETEPANESQIFELIDEVARRILAAEHDGPAGRLARSAAETTASLSALKHFLEADRHFVAGRWISAREVYSCAVAEDPGLALAWERMSWASCWLLLPDEARAFADRALASIDRLSERDALRLHAFRAYLHGNSAEAEQNYRSLLSRWPDDVQSYVGLGLSLLMLNPMRGRSPDEGIDPLSYALILDPENIDARLMLTYLLSRHGNHDELDSLRAWLPADSDYKLMVASNHAVARKNIAEMSEIRGILQQAPDMLVHECVRYAAVIGRDWGEAQRLAAVLTSATRAPAVRAMGHILMGQAHVVRGCLKAARQEYRLAQTLSSMLAGAYGALAAILPFANTSQKELDSLRRELASWDTDTELDNGVAHLSFLVHSTVYPQLREYLLGMLNLRMGKKARALHHAARLESLSGTNEAVALGHDLSLSVRAQSANEDGNLPEALHLFDLMRFQPSYERVQMQSPFFSENLERYTRGRLLESAGRLDEALRWYDNLCENGLHEFVYLAPTHLRRGLIRQRLGDRDHAIEHFRHVRELWCGADAALQPTVAEATRQLSRLGWSVQ